MYEFGALGWRLNKMESKETLIKAFEREDSYVHREDLDELIKKLQLIDGVIEELTALSQRVTKLEERLK
jgi:hypothetical protein